MGDCASTVFVDQDWTQAAERPATTRSLLTASSEPRLMTTVYSPTGDAMTITPFDNSYSTATGINCVLNFTVRKAPASLDPLPDYITFDFSGPLTITLQEVDPVNTYADVNAEFSET